MWHEKFACAAGFLNSFIVNSSLVSIQYQNLFKVITVTQCEEEPTSSSAGIPFKLLLSSAVVQGEIERLTAI